ncbi:response regulator [Litchfieldia sinesaloumensis]|uniref:response regulator n=1 Tax=Litchfieldia sinesaloumensis TaxID=1926280 RepID=UPI00098865C0|nr:response regulator [Bacillus sinesaloumensis]
MLKAVIFDDEFIVLKGLQMIEWSKYGIEIVGTAMNGIEAIEVYQKYRPDIVFTDIRMPGIDGLRVIERIIEDDPDTICIVFSGFNEFDYVKRAIKLGVTDYLEKPITIPIIEETITRILDKVNMQKSVTALQSRWEDSREELLVKATLDLLLIGEDMEQKFRESFGEKNKWIKNITVYALSDKGPMIQSNSSYQSVYVRNGEENLLVVFHFDSDRDDLNQLLSDWQEQSQTFIGCGRTYANLVDAKKSYKEAKEALRYGRFMKEGWTDFQNIAGNTKIVGNLSDLEEQIIFHLRTGDKEGLLNQIDSFMSQLNSERLSPNVIEREILKLVYLALEVAKETGEDIDPNRAYLPHLEIRELDTKERMMTWLQEQMEMIFNWTRKVRQLTKHDAVNKACEYMREHYSKDLTLQEVSDYVGMNPTYFSLLFKEEMKESYIKYLTQLRMDRAKEFLKAGYKVADVSERVGYYSPRHFSDTFKKYVGVKPSQYKTKS